MEIKPPFTDIDIRTAERGFYEGQSKTIALFGKGVVLLLVLWALMDANAAGEALSAMNSTLLDTFNTFYLTAAGFFAFFCLAVAVVPSSGRRILGKEGEKPEFSRLSWFSMMFGAGMGISLMVYATAEPLGLWGSNPVLLQSDIAPNSVEALESAFRYSFLHYGFHPWAMYVVVGLSLAYYGYRRGMPLTMRSTLTPVLGKAVNGIVGDLVDILGVVATILGVSVSVGFGASQLVDGLYNVTGMEWLRTTAEDGVPRPTTVGLLVGVAVVMSMSIASAASGVRRGIKALSNLNLFLSFALLFVFVFAGSFTFAVTTYGQAFVDYLLNFVLLSFEAYPTSTDVGAWQASWTVFYWAWWIAFSPFVGLFLARISRGRSIREFVLAAMIAPSLVCFAWIAFMGGTAVSYELSGAADGAILSASTTDKLFVTLESFLDGGFLKATLIVAIVLICTFLVTSVDSGILVMNTIASGGSLEKSTKHTVAWGATLTAAVAALLLAGGGGLEALKSAMLIGALPFTMVMVLMCASLTKALLRDSARSKFGVKDD